MIRGGFFVAVLVHPSQAIGVGAMTMNTLRHDGRGNHEEGT